MKLKLNNKQIAIFGGIVVLLIIAGLWLWMTNGRTEAAEIAANKYREGNIEGASAEYKKLLDSYGGTAEIWNNYGNTLRDLKKYDEASAAYKQAIAADAKYPLAYRNLSYLYLDLEEEEGIAGKIDEAIAIIEQGFEKAGDSKLFLAEDLIMLYGKKGDQTKVDKYKAIREELLAEE